MAISTAAGTNCVQPTGFSDPAPQVAASIAISSFARSTRKELNAVSIADTPMPTTISRKPCIPRR
jgi:hypothetical protein